MSSSYEILEVRRELANFRASVDGRTRQAKLPGRLVSFGMQAEGFARPRHTPDRETLRMGWARLPNAERGHLGDRLWRVGMMHGLLNAEELMDSGLPAHIGRTISNAADAIYDAMPFSFGERDWLHGVVVDVNSSDPDPVGRFPNLLETLLSKSGRVLEVADPGRRDPRGSGPRDLPPISGAEITERFWDWRRQSGEFVGDTGYGDATAAARYAAALLFHESGHHLFDLPERYQR